MWCLITRNVEIIPTLEISKLDNENNDVNIVYKLVGRASFLIIFRIKNLARKCVGLKNGNNIILNIKYLLYKNKRYLGLFSSFI